MVRAFADVRIRRRFSSNAFGEHSRRTLSNARFPQGAPFCRIRVDFDASGGERLCVFGNREFPFCPAQLLSKQRCRDNRKTMGGGLVNLVWDTCRVAGRRDKNSRSGITVSQRWQMSCDTNRRRGQRSDRCRLIHSCDRHRDITQSLVNLWGGFPSGTRSESRH